MALPYCGNKGVYNCEQARLGPGYRGEMLWASPAMDYLGPEQSSVNLYYRDGSTDGFPRLLQALGIIASSEQWRFKPDTLACAVVNLQNTMM